jgi:hypothetical protein
LRFDGLDAYGHPIHVFQPAEIREAINVAATNGFRLIGSIDLRCEEKAVHWERLDLDFTFVFLAFEKPEATRQRGCTRTPAFLHRKVVLSVPAPRRCAGGTLTDEPVGRGSHFASREGTRGFPRELAGR